MQTYTELQTELLARLMAASNSTLYTTTRIQTLIKDAHTWATSRYMWPQLEKAKTTHTQADHYYYDYPGDFRTDAIIRIIIDDERYDRKAYEDFLDYKDNNPTDLSTHIFADYGRQIFIFPTPATTGSSNFDVWGCIQATQLSAGTDETIFSNHDESGNEAIVKKALSVAIGKQNKQLAVQEETEAKEILAVIWDKISKRQQRDQRIDHPMFSVPNYFQRGTGASGVGKFSYQP
jgi:hypothetical protein